MSHLLSLEKVTDLKERLRELKNEWISKKDGYRGTSIQYIDKDTVVQILEYATHGITTWDFEIIEQWKEDIYKNFSQKGQAPQWGFDGYVYHVKGKLTIHGLGSRMQYGKKVAEGGSRNQDSAYQAAASTCLSKCASLFGVGEKLYVKNQIQTKEESYDQSPQQYNDQQGYQQMNQQQGFSYNNDQATLQNQMNGMQNQQQWNQQAQQQNEMNNPWANYNQGSTDQNINWNQTIQEVDQSIQNGSVQFPFNQAPAQNQKGQQVDNFQAEPQGQVQEQSFQAKTMGAPIINDQPKEDQNIQPTSSTETVENPKGSDQQQLFMEQVSLYNQHRTRLGVQNDEGMLPYLRDYFQNEKADTSLLNMETIKGFNKYMESIQA